MAKKDDGEPKKKGKTDKKNHEHRVVRFGSIYYGYTYEEGETSPRSFSLLHALPSPTSRAPDAFLPGLI